MTDEDQRLWTINYAYARGFITAIEKDTIVTVDEYEDMLGIEGVPAGWYRDLTRAAYKDQMTRGKIDGVASLYYAPD